MNVDVQRDNCGSIDIGFYKQRAAQLRREAILELANTISRLVLAPIPAWFCRRRAGMLNEW
jgi:hypothetical protein